MASLILPSRRVVQPQGPVEVDPRYRGAVARLNIPAISLIDLATGQAATTTGSATSTAIFSNRQGFEKQVHPSSGALGYSSWSWGPDDGITDDATFLFVGHPQNYSTANGGLIIRGLTSTWNLGLYYTDGNTLNAGTVTSSPVTGFTASIGSLSLTIGDEQRCLLSRRGGLITVYNWRTRQQASTSVTGTGLRNSTSGIIIGATISSGASSHQRHALTAALKQGVTDNEAWALLDNPWQLFRPLQRRIWVPVAGGGGISQTVAFTLEDVSASVSQNLSHTQSLTGTLDDVAVSISQTVQHSQALSATLDGVTVAAAQTLSHSQALAATLDGVTVAASQTLNHSQALAATLDGITVDINQSAAPSSKEQSLAVVLDGISFDAVQVGALPAVGGMGFVFTDTPSALWWKRKPKALSDEVAEQKVGRVVRVIKEIAGKQQPEQTAKQAQRQVAQAIAPMVADMPGFDWTPLYRTIVAEFQRQREEAARIEAVAQIARIRALEQDDEDILLLMI